MENENNEEIEAAYIEEIEVRERELYSLVIAGTSAVVNYHNNYLLKEPCRDSSHTGYKFIMEILEGNERRCHEMFRMEKHVFHKLCDTLKNNYNLRATRGIILEEALGMFLLTLGHGVGNRMIQEQFQHSGETVSRQFSNVLKAMTRFTCDIIKPIENYDEVAPHIRRNTKYWPYFKDCIGALDGTHVQVTIPVEDQIPYIGRKGYPTTNIMASCDFNMCFTFAWPGWEGTAHDTRIFYEALRTPSLNFKQPPGDKYYLVDAGYPNIKGFLAPYKGERYHLPQFRRGRQPSGPKEIFNQCHSSLRSVIERTFGVWKARWAILQCMPYFNYNKQIAIIGASMALHNFIRQEALADIEFQAYDENEDYLPDGVDTQNDGDERLTVDDSEMGAIRDRIAIELSR